MVIVQPFFGSVKAYIEAFLSQGCPFPLPDRSPHPDCQATGSMICSSWKSPFVVVLNKMDLIPKGEREQVLAVAAHNLDLGPSEVIGMVATEGDNVGRVILAVTKADPKLVKAIADALPEYHARLPCATRGGWQVLAQPSRALGT